MVTLQEILSSKESIILIDTSIRSGSIDERGVGWDIYDAQTYVELNHGDLIRGGENIRFLTLILEHPNTATIPKITQEIKNLEQVLSNKIKFLNENHRNRQGYHANKGRRFRKQKERSASSESLLKELQQRTYCLYRLSERKELTFEESTYQPLLEMIKLIDEAIGLKQDTHLLYHERDKPEIHDSDTDEKLTAALFYLSMFSDKPPILLTRDGDMVRLVGVIPRLIGADNFLPENKRFREAVIFRNPFRLYYLEEADFNLAIERKALIWNFIETLFCIKSMKKEATT